MVYDLPVEEEKIKPHQITTLHLVCSLAFMLTGAIIYRYNFIITTWGLALLLVGISLLVVVMVKNKWIISKQVNLVARLIELAITIWIAVYSILQQWKFPSGIFGVLSAVIAFAIYWERNGSDKLAILVDEEGVKLPVTYRKRFIAWTEIEQVVLRFGTLSVDCVDNRLFQWNTTGIAFDTEAFESFCQSKVEENRSKRRNDEW